MSFNIRDLWIRSRGSSRSLKSHFGSGKRAVQRPRGHGPCRGRGSAPKWYHSHFLPVDYRQREAKEEQKKVVIFVLG